MKKYHGRRETPERNFMDCWTTEHTHRVETHKHNLCSLVSCQLESGNNHHCSSVVDRVNESLTYRRKLLMIWSDSSVRLLADSNEIRKKKFEKTRSAFVIPACRNNAVNRQFSSVKGWHGGERNSTRNPCAGVDVSWEEHGIRRHRECVDLADGDGWWLVAGVVKTCSDGALDVRNMSKSWWVKFPSGCLSPMQS